MSCARLIEFSSDFTAYIRTSALETRPYLQICGAVPEGPILVSGDDFKRPQYLNVPKYGETTEQFRPYQEKSDAQGLVTQEYILEVCIRTRRRIAPGHRPVNSQHKQIDRVH